MIRRAATLAIALCYLAIPAWALDPSTPLSQYARTAWTEREGLVSGLIWAIAQDRDGYLWLGTDSGLIRFDGVRFVHIAEPSLKDVRVGALLSTSDGSLWIGSGSPVGLTRLHDGLFTSYGVSDGLPLGITALLEDHDKTLWAGGRGGLSRFTNGRWQIVGNAQGLSDEAVTGLFEDRHRTLWVATLRGLFRLRVGASHFEAAPALFHVRRLTDDKEGRIWAVGPDQAVGLPMDAAANSRFTSWKDVNGWTLTRDRDGNMWIAALGSGLLRISNSAQGLAPTVQRIGSDTGLSHDVVRSIFEDREGNIWVGTQHGLNRFSDSAIKMMTSTADLSQPVRAVTDAPDGSVWVGTDNGVYRFADGTITHFDRGEGLGALSIGSLYTDRTGTVWAAADHGGVARFERGRFVVEIDRRPRLKRVWAFTRDNEGAMWMCEVDAGLFRWKPGELTGFTGTPDVGRRFCNAVVTDRQGRVWIGFTDGSVGLWQHDRFRFFGRDDGLAGGAVNVLYEDSRGVLWVGSVNGLTSYANGRFEARSDSGSPLMNVRAIVEDENHDVWIGDSSGVARIDDRTGKTPALGMFDGLRGVPMAVGGLPKTARSGDGRLWFVTSGGLAVLDPARLARTRLPAPVRIEEVFADGVAVPTSGAVALPPKTSRLEFNYTGLSLTTPEKLRFRYRLEGFDTDWIDGGTRRQAFYTNLPPRSYRFSVMADNDGVLSQATATLDFEIRPTFFQTAWFYVLVAAALALVVVAAWHVRQREVNRQFALVLGERTRVAREIHDTLLQSLVGVAFQFDAASGELEAEPSVAKARLARLRTQIELAIKEARRSIWDLRNPSLERRDLASVLREIGETITGQSVRFDLSVTGAPTNCPQTLDEALLRIGREAISNAVRHASATEVHVEIAYEADEVTLRVIDNGCGLETGSTEVAHHWGLATMRERAEQLGGRLRLASAPGRGTQVEFIAPCAKGQSA